MAFISGLQQNNTLYLITEMKSILCLGFLLPKKELETASQSLVQLKVQPGTK